MGRTSTAGRDGMLGALALAAVVAGPAAAQDRAVDFSIRPQAMDKALKVLSEQSGLRVLYPYDGVAHLMSPAVTGRMLPRVALERMIARTPLKITLMQNGVVALAVLAPARPMTLQRTADVGDAPSAAVQPAGATEPPAAVSGNGATGAPSADVPSAVSEVVVTGVRGQARTVTDSPTPIDVITSSELEHTGRIGAFQALETLIPSFNLPVRAGGGTATVISTGGLRGLNPDQTLVLVDGKRRHKTSLINSVSSLYNGSVPADLDLLPTAGISRIEVLRDGAAAQYGSDAIAGVINIILKDAPGGFISATRGANFNRGADGEFTQLEGSYGTKIGDKGFLTAFFNTKDQDLSNRAVPVGSNIQIYPKINGQPDPREATVDRLVTQNYGQLPQWGVNLGYDVHYDIAPDVRLYSFGTYSRRVSDLPFTFRAPNSVNDLPQIYPEGFRPDLVIRENDYEFAVGAKGNWRGWNWDLSSTYGYNIAKENVAQTLNASLGPTSPTTFYVGSLESSEWVNSLDVTRPFHVDRWGDVQVSFGLQHRRETYDVDAGTPLSYAAGSYVIPAGQPFAGQRPATGAQAAPGFQPADASSSSRNNYAAYGELGWTPFKKLFVDAALRYEDYDDASGDKVIGKFDGRYELTDWFALRGAISNGFRAPALAQEHFAATSSQFRLVNNQLDLLLIKTLPVGSPQAIALGAKPLTPETSNNYSAGFSFTPARNLSVTVDAYRIDVAGRIALTGTLTGTAVSNILIANGLSGDLSAQYYTNAIDTRTDGIDVVGTYRMNLGDYGIVRWNLGFNTNHTDITHIIANPPQLTALGPGFVLFDRLSQGYLTKALPRNKLALGSAYTWRGLDVTLRATRYGGFTVLQDAVASDRKFGPKVITDLEAAYHLPHNVTLAVGANNLFNIYPSKNAIFNATIGSGQYPGTSPFGFTGGSYYGRVQLNF